MTTLSNKYILEFAESAKSSHTNHLESLINHATQHTNIFQFTELLQVQNIKDLQNGPHKKSYDLLCLFAYSTYQEWVKNKDKYNNLNDQQIKKLRMLTIVDLAQNEKVLGFELLKYELGINNQDELEDLIIESIYTGIITGKINQSDRVLRVGNVISRDVKVTDIQNIKNRLVRILQENNKVQEKLQQKIVQLDQEKAQDLENKKFIQESRQVVQSLQQNQKKK
ncbi:hypothetical protein ABPG74_012059 [Tetrahymena malaccensis]